MADITPAKRERIYTALSNGRSTAWVTKQFGISPQQVAAFRAHITMGTWKPAKTTTVRKPAARKLAAKTLTANRMQFSVPRDQLRVSYKGNLANVSVTF